MGDDTIRVKPFEPPSDGQVPPKKPAEAQPSPINVKIGGVAREAMAPLAENTFQAPPSNQRHQPVMSLRSFRAQNPPSPGFNEGLLRAFTNLLAERGVSCSPDLGRTLKVVTDLQQLRHTLVESLDNPGKFSNFLHDLDDLDNDQNREIAFKRVSDHAATGRTLVFNTAEGLYAIHPDAKAGQTITVEDAEGNVEEREIAHAANLTPDDYEALQQILSDPDLLRELIEISRRITLEATHASAADKVEQPKAAKPPQNLSEVVAQHAGPTFSKEIGSLQKRRLEANRSNYEDQQQLEQARAERDKQKKLGREKYQKDKEEFREQKIDKSIKKDVLNLDLRRNEKRKEPQ